MVKTGRGGGLEGNGGQGTRNKALDTGIFRPLGPKKAQTLNKSLTPTLDIKKKINKPKTVNKSLVPNSPSVINPASTPDSGGSMFESETGEEEPDDKDKPKDKEKTTKKPIPIYAMEEGEVPGDWSEEDYWRRRPQHSLRRLGRRHRPPRRTPYAFSNGHFDLFFERTFEGE